MTIDTDKLRSAAIAAEQRDWRVGRFIENGEVIEAVGRYQVVVDTDHGPYVILSGNQNFITEAEANAAFVAAANPSAILALLDELDRLRAEVKTAEEKANGHYEAWRIARARIVVLEEAVNASDSQQIDAAHLAGYRLAQEQAAGICDDNELYQTALEIRVLQPPAEWGE